MWRVKGENKKSRQRSTLPHSHPCSTIDAKELNYRVRDGIGCGLFAIITGKIVKKRQIKGGNQAFPPSHLISLAQRRADAISLSSLERVPL